LPVRRPGGGMVGSSLELYDMAEIVVQRGSGVGRSLKRTVTKPAESPVFRNCLARLG